MSRTPTLRRRSEAFSLIEVMVAVALLTASASGILLMQGATSSANQQAHESSVATDFAQTWVERLKRDSLRWTQIGETDRTDADGPIYLDGALSGTGEDNWLTPAFTDATESHAADPFGFDVHPTIDGARVRYCMNYRNVVQHLAPNPLTLLLDTDTLRVDVRVWWVRRGDRRDLVVANAANPCAAPPTQGDFQNMLARVIYVSTVVRWETP